MRAYTLREIDHMREAIGRYGFPDGVCYIPSERTKEIEERIRTYMVANLDPAQLVSDLRDRYIEELNRGMVVVRTEWKDGTKISIHANGNRSWTNEEGNQTMAGGPRR